MDRVFRAIEFSFLLYFLLYCSPLTLLAAPQQDTAHQVSADGCPWNAAPCEYSISNGIRSWDTQTNRCFLRCEITLESPNPLPICPDCHSNANAACPACNIQNECSGTKSFTVDLTSSYPTIGECQKLTGNSDNCPDPEDSFKNKRYTAACGPFVMKKSRLESPTAGVY